MHFYFSNSSYSFIFIWFVFVFLFFSKIKFQKSNWNWNWNFNCDLFSIRNINISITIQLKFLHILYTHTHSLTTHSQTHRFVFKLFRWKTRGMIKASSLVPFLAASFGSTNYSELSKLHDTIMDMIDDATPNICLQHRLLTNSINTNSMVAKLDQFEHVDYHDEFADWLLQSKLEESGFILTPSMSKRDGYGYGYESDYGVGGLCSTAPITNDAKTDVKIVNVE